MTLAQSQRQRLPPELILHIIESLLPPNEAAILPASSSATKTLISFTLVSRSTYDFASRLLRQRCMHIDSSRRLSLVLLSIPEPPLATLPPTFSLKCITSLYLSPFGKTLDDKPLALWVRELFCEVCMTLRRLVVDLPLETLSAYDDHLDIRPTLLDGFSRLTKLEELVFLRHFPGSMFKPTSDTADRWSLWPQLKRVVLFTAPVDSHWLWYDIASSHFLREVVLVRPQNLAGTNIKEMLRNVWNSNSILIPRQVQVTLADVENDLAEVLTTRWAEYDPTEMVMIKEYYVPTSFYGDDDTATLCCDWVKAAALRGTIWNW